MLKNNLSLYTDYLLLMKDEEININFLLTNDIFIKYLNNEVNKEYLLDEHTNRNKLFIEWCEIYNYKK
jgi:hypothetical protein